MKLADAVKGRAHNLYIACDTELFDKRIKPWELQVLFLNEKIKNKSKNSALTLIFKQIKNVEKLTLGFYLHAGPRVTRLEEQISMEWDK